jgi:hypothetical protein
MPKVSRFFVKVSFLWLVLALISGAGMAFGGPRWLAILLPTYIHIFVVGWVTQMIIGVAIWLFPKQSRETPRGRSALNWTAFWGLNLGLVLRVVAEPGPMLAPASAWSGLLVISALLQWVGGMAFVGNIWPRVKGNR